VKIESLSVDELSGDKIRYWPLLFMGRLMTEFFCSILSLGSDTVDTINQMYQENIFIKLI
jgi:hypothetical protein